MYQFWYIWTVLSQELTMTQAARELGVTRRRVQAFVDAGQLPAERAGHQWMISADSVRWFNHVRPLRRGRPLSADGAWSEIDEAASGRARLWSRDELDRFRREVRPRASHRQLYIHPGLRSRLAAGSMLGGRDAVSMIAPVDSDDVMDAYVSHSASDSLVAALHGVDASRNPNLWLHVVPDAVWDNLSAGGQRTVGAWVAWCDLEDRRDRAADTLLDYLVGGRLAS